MFLKDILLQNKNGLQKLRVCINFEVCKRDNSGMYQQHIFSGLEINFEICKRDNSGMYQQHKFSGLEILHHKHLFTHFHLFVLVKIAW